MSMSRAITIVSEPAASAGAIAAPASSIVEAVEHRVGWEGARDALRAHADAMMVKRAGTLRFAHPSNSPLVMTLSLG